MANVTREELLALREEIISALSVISTGTSALWAVTDKVYDAALTIPETPAPEPIKDTRVYVESRSRYGISHAVTVTDGKLRCTCEDATYRPHNGPCFHASTAVLDGRVDNRAVWDGGLRGLPEAEFNFGSIDELLLDVN